MTRFVLTPLAKEDLDEIYEYIRKDNPDASRELYEPSRRSGALEQRLLEIDDLTVLESNFQVLIYVDHFCARLQDLLGCSKDLVDLLDGLT